MKKRLLSIVMSMMLVVSMMPATAFAAEEDSLDGAREGAAAVEPGAAASTPQDGASQSPDSDASTSLDNASGGGSGVDASTPQEQDDASEDSDAASKKAAQKAARANDASGNSFRVTQQEMKWLAGEGKSSEGVVSSDGKTLTLNATDPAEGETYATASYSLTFAPDETGAPLKPGAVTLRVPAHIFKDRKGAFIKTPVGKVAEIGKDESGKAVSVTEPSGPKAPSTTGADNSYNWTYDEESDEIVFTNFEEVSQSGGFTVTVKYQISSTQVESGATADCKAANYNVKIPGGDTLAEGSLGSLKIQVNTDVGKPRAGKQVGSKYESWQTDTWGPAPAGADDANYYYVEYLLTSAIMASEGDTYTTQPFTLTFDETKASNSSNTADDQDMLVWTTGSTASDGTPDWVSSFNGVTGAEGMKADVVYATSPDGPRATDSNWDKLSKSVSRRVVIRYPRSATENNATPKLSNNFKANADGVDGAHKQNAAFASYTYARVGFEWGGDKWSMSKTDDMKKQPEDNASRIPNTWGGRQYGGLSLLRLGKPYSQGTWKICIENQQAKVDADGVALPADQQPAYGTVLRDGMLFIAGERLNGNSANPDYSFDAFSVDSFVESTFVLDPNLGQQEKPVEEIDGFGGYDATYHPITVLVRTVDNNEWHEVGTLTKTGEDTYSYGGQTYAKNEKIAFPAGTYDVKFSHMGNQNKVSYRINLHNTLYPTDHVMGLVGDNVTEFDVFNINDAYLTDAAGNKTTAGNKALDSTTEGIATAVAQSDAEEYADGASYHDWSQHTYRSFEGNTQFDKNMSTPAVDDANRIARVSVTLKYFNSVTVTSAGMTLAEGLDVGAVTEQRETKFYDLLPAGCTVDYSTIKVGPTGKTSGYFTAMVLDENGKAVLNDDGSIMTENVKVSDYDYTVETIQDWRGSGQTMLVITVAAPDGHSNFDGGSKKDLRSGFTATFDMIDAFDNIAMAGGRLDNYAAIASQDGPLVSGEADDGGTLPNKDQFAGLNEPGGDLDGLKNCKYASNSKTVSPTVGSQYAFKKYVKGAQDVAYSNSTVVPPTGSYSYQLLAQNDNFTKQSDIVFYDILDNSHGSKDHWEGTLTGVEFSQAVKNGVDVKVYYSTRPKNEWGDLALPGSDGSDLDNTAIWSTDAPDDLSTVTAVAFDCSKANANADANHTDGKGNFVLPTNEQLACYLFMKAPDKAPQATGDDVTKAYNSAFNKSKRYNNGDSTGTESTTESDKTTVEIGDSPTELDKTSDPASGTADAPTVVEADDTLTYNLGVTNKNVAEAIADVIVVDTIPEGLSVDFDNIKYYSNNHVSSTKPCDGTGLVKVENEGQKLTFTISRVDARQTIHLVIPTTVDATANLGKTYDNKAKITGYNGGDFDIESQETHHKSDPVTTSVSVTKAWSDDNDAAGVRPADASMTVELYADNVATGQTADLNEGNGWTATLSDLAKYKADGTTQIQYSVVEDADDAGPYYVPSYSAQGTDITVTNTLSTTTKESVSFDIHKLRAGTDLAVPDVTFGLYSDEECTQLVGQTQVTDANGDVAFAFGEEGAHQDDADRELEFHDADGKPLSSITLYVKELSAPHGYTIDATPQKLTLTRPTQAEITPKADDGVVEYHYVWSVTPQADSLLAGTDNSFAMSNAYAPTPVDVILSVGKTIDDATTPNGSNRPAEKTFTFTLTPQGDAPASANATVTTTGEGTASFGEIHFTQPGTYQYVVSETNDDQAGYTYASDHTIVVTVTDVNGFLKYTCSDNGATMAADDLISFVNGYEAAPASASIEVAKQVVGCPRTEGLEKAFTFELTTETGAPMPKDADGNVVTITDAGKASFGQISFERPGTYLYKMNEVVPNEPFPGYVFDTKDIYAQVVVTDHDGQLAVDSTTYGTMVEQDDLMVFQAGDDQDASMTFVNEYAPAAADLSLPVSKRIEGEKPGSDETFQFKIEGVDGAPMPESELASITGEGSASFASMRYTEPGTYAYKVSEVAGDAAGFTYDETVYDVVVTVTDNDGSLEAAWTANDQAVDAVTFTNKYVKDETDDGGKTTKAQATSKAAASKLSTTGDYLAVGVVALAAIAVVALVVASVVRKRKKDEKDEKDE